MNKKKKMKGTLILLELLLMISAALGLLMFAVRININDPLTWGIFIIITLQTLAITKFELRYIK